jgi:cytochrome c oxidase subunit II
MDSFINWFKHGVLQLPFLASNHGGRVDNFVVYVHWLMLALFVGWLAYFFYALFRFRASRQRRADPVGVRHHGSTYIEGVVALLELGLLVGLAIPLWATVVDRPPPAERSTEIHILGRQFNWMARYSGVDGKFGKQDPKLSSASDPFGVDREHDETGRDDVVVQGIVVVPVGQQVICHVSSLDVIHNFTVHSMRVSQDAIPGMSIPVWFTPVKEGEYKITCAQLCGNAHYSMFGVLKVVSEQEYGRWLREQSAKARGAGTQAVSYE